MKYVKCNINYGVAKPEDFEFSFETPGQYLEFRAEWKAIYRHLSGEIRAMKDSRCSDNGGYIPGLLEAQRNARNQMTCLAAAKLEGKARKAKALADRELAG